MLNKIEKLNKQSRELRNKAYKLEQKEIEIKILPKLKNMIGWCMKSEYSETYSKILEWGNNKKWGFFFILEQIEINEQGQVSLKITSDNPYTNKEWWKAEIPLYGIERISSEVYENKKSELLNEMMTRDKLRKFKKGED
jgi:hypothetical protein